MKYVFVNDNNFEDIFGVSAKYEQREYVKHHVFDMVNNYVAVINERYLPLPFLVYKEEKLIAYVQLNYYEQTSIYDICKLIVHETEQNKGYGTYILEDVIRWIQSNCESGTITSTYNKNNLLADKLFSKFGFEKKENEEQVCLSFSFFGEAKYDVKGFESIPYTNVGEMVLKLKKEKRIPECLIGNPEKINFKRIDEESSSILIEMCTTEEQEDFVMPFVDSLASAYSEFFEKEVTVAYALCDGNKTVGLIEIAFVNGEEFPEFQNKNVYELFRLIVDKKYQKQGYGKKAVELFLDYVEKKPLGEADVIVLSVVEGNDVAYQLYEKCGFQYFGRDKYQYRAMKKSI